MAAGPLPGRVAGKGNTGAELVGREAVEQGRQGRCVDSSRN
jgi:hypothetical protein